jgi:anti-sigma regulatory factor (Ser/Thr protein kinase)
MSLELMTLPDTATARLLSRSRGIDSGMRRTVVLHRDPSAAAAARGVVDDFTAVLGPRRADARLVASELITKSVGHEGDDPSKPIVFSVELSPESLRIEVRDDETAHENARVKAHQRAFRGLGLVIVNTLADAWGVHGNGPIRVWARFDRAPAASAGPRPTPATPGC